MDRYFVDDRVKVTTTGAVGVVVRVDNEGGDNAALVYHVRFPDETVRHFPAPALEPAPKREQTENQKRQTRQKRV